MRRSVSRCYDGPIERVIPWIVLAALLSPGVSHGADEAQPSPYPTSTAGPCPTSAAPPCTIVLSGAGAPSASPECTAEAWTKLVRFTLPGRWIDSDENGSWESVLALTLDPARSCGCARIRTFFAEEADAWILHVANSPTNNGHGGDEGTTPHAAELHIIDRRLAVFTAALFEHRVVERLADLTLPPLGGKILEVEVCDQTLTVTLRRTLEESDPQRWRLETLNSKLLFSFGSGSTTLYAGFNRVVHALGGAASHNRVGSGVRRVEIELIP